MRLRTMIKVVLETIHPEKGRYYEHYKRFKVRIRQKRHNKQVAFIWLGKEHKITQYSSRFNGQMSIFQGFGCLTVKT